MRLSGAEDPSDGDTKACWLVKFRRGSARNDTQILQAEAGYHKVASLVGLHTFKECTWENHCLLVPRFDRIVAKDKITYLGLESFYSMVGQADFGSRLRHETYLKGIARFSSKPQSDLIEYCLRDFLNQMLGNTDNHGRNQSLLKGESDIRLAPLYDFAPMKFDPEGIVRNTRWQESIEDGNLTLLTEMMTGEFMVQKGDWDAALAFFYKSALKLEKLLAQVAIPKEFIEGTKQERDFVLKNLRLYCERQR